MKSFLERFRRKGPEETSEGEAQELFSKAESSKLPAVVVPPATTSAADPLFSRPVRGPPERQPDSGDVRLELGDFLHRIPLNLLRPGPHHVGAEMRFEIGELSALIAKGQTTINLAELYRRMPSIFRAEVRATDNIEIRFPWQKLLNLVKEAGDGGKNSISKATAESLGQKLRSRRPTRNILPVNAALSLEAPAREDAKPKPQARERASGTIQKSDAEPPVGASVSTSPATAAVASPAITGQPVIAAPLAKELPPLRIVPPTAPAASEAKTELPSSPVNGTESPDEAHLERERLAAELDRTRRELAEQSARAAKINAESDALVLRIQTLEQGGGAQVAAIAEERDRIKAELEKARQELVEKERALEQAQSQAATVPDERLQAAAAQEALEEKIAALNKQVEATNEELAAARRRNDEQLQALQAGRDTLALVTDAEEQLAHATEALETKQKTGLEVARSKKENQRSSTNCSGASMPSRAVRRKSRRS